jgi:endonuclease VIII
MPEGDMVWLAAKRLRSALAGRGLTRSDFRVPALSTVDLSGHVVHEVVSRGKHLLFRFDSGLTLHTHFMMDGTWRIFRPGERWRGGPPWQVRAVLENTDWQAVGYRLPVVELLPTAEEPRVVGHLGPDLLGPDWDLAEAVRHTAATPDRPIGLALLDQRNLAGIGNLYKAETCFLRGVSPWTPTGEVPDLPAMIALARRLLDANKEGYAQCTTGDLRRGRSHWVYDRARQPCWRCGTLIAVAMQGQAPADRATYWCPHCQPGPAPAPPSDRFRR